MTSLEMTESNKSMSSTNRREFMQGLGGLTLVVGSSGLITACSPEQAAEIAQASTTNAITPNIWVTIGADDTVTIQYPATEMGQGSSTSLPAILADELDADWSNVVVETVEDHDPAYANPVFGMQYTAGSFTLSAFFEPLRRAGAQTRKLLMQSAAEEWGVPVTEIVTEPSVVVHSPSGRRLSYGQVVAFTEVPETFPEIDDSELKSEGEYRYIGTDVPRLDMRAKSNGSAEFGIDVQVPGMAYASVLRAPVEDEGPLEVDDGAARAIEGVTDVVALPWGVAVVAETYEASKWGTEALDVTWSETSRFRKTHLETDLDDFATQAEDLTQSGVAWRSTGNAPEAIDSAAEVVQATYRSDPAYHAQMEPMNATANVTENGKAAEIWVSTQSQTLSTLGAAEFLETTPDQIKLHPTFIGGGFGRRALRRQQYVEDALYISRALGRPIKVIWSREDDVKNGAFRNAAAQTLRAGFDTDGKLVGWQHRVATSKVLESADSARWEVAQGRDVLAMLGTESARYDIPNFLAEHVITDRRSRVCAWRGVATSYTKFAAESFVDELAHARGIDPLEFRMQLCHNNPRALGVLEAAAEMADWSRPRENTALGLGLAGYSSTFAAGIAEVSVDPDSGELTVHNYWLAADAGYVLAPRNSEAQLEGNVIFGISNALRERIDIRGGQVVQSNYYDYPVLRMNEIPNIEVRAISTDNAPTGMGEIGLASTGAALANAVYALTGARVRHLPLTPARIKAAMDA